MKELPAYKILNWLNRYGPMCEFLDETNGYGTYVVSLHGRHIVNVGRVGKKILLQPIEYRVVAYNMTAGI